MTISATCTTPCCHRCHRWTSAEGAEAVVELVARTDSTIVVGRHLRPGRHREENEADTVRADYRYTASALKRLGLTQVRIDHAGKNASKGQRGSSAKADDVDVVWRVQRTDDGALLTRTHSRMSWVPERVDLLRATAPMTTRSAGRSVPAAATRRAPRR